MKSNAWIVFTLAFARPRSVSVNNTRVTVVDPQNGRAVELDLVYAAGETCDID